ncbi:hypothetical protein [Amycolatopsis sp. lyj-23]
MNVFVVIVIAAALLLLLASAVRIVKQYEQGSCSGSAGWWACASRGCG